MKKKYIIIFILLFITLFILCGCDNTNKNNSNNNVEISKTDLELNTTNSNTNSTTNNSNNTTSPNSNNTSNSSINNNLTNQNTATQTPVETELANFSTTIIDKTENRQNNIRITCSKLNNLTINSGDSFSFLKTIGETTAEAGYKEADILVNGKLTKGLGGGNCQVSTTVYNAALNSEGLEITEHHDHGKKVPYIEEGKDATIAFPSLDLKFKNNLQNPIKIYASTDGNSITVKIVKIS